jgi:hypothetical protein
VEEQESLVIEPPVYELHVKCWWHAEGRPIVRFFDVLMHLQFQVQLKK